MTVRGVFFDLDDTLYPYDLCNEAAKQAAWRQFRDLGYDLDREGFEDLYQEARGEVKRELAGTASAHERFLYFKRAIQIHAGTHRSRDALALGETYWNTYVEEMSLYDGVEETLETLQDRGIDVALVTNLTTRIQLQKIEHLGIEPYLDYLLTSEETGREKPASVMFTLPLARLDRRPSEVVMVGDSIDTDIEGGNAVGLETVLFDPRDEVDTDRLTDRRRPDHQIDDFRDLTEVIL